MMVLLVKMEQQVYQGALDSQVKRVNQGPKAKGVLQAREVDRGFPVVVDTSLRMHSQ